MATGLQVRTAWNTSIWSNATIQAITSKIYNYDVTKQSSKEVSKFYLNQEVNFITYLVSRAQRLRIMQQIEQQFIVDIRYYLVADTEGVNYNALLDAFETIDSLVISQLGTTWGGSVDYYELQSEPVAITEIQIENVSVWAGQYKYLGFKNL